MYLDCNNLSKLENSSLDYVLAKDKVIILEFYTPWCPTCKMVSMMLEEFEEEHPEYLVLQINAEKYKSIAEIYKVKTAPTLLFIYHSKVYNVHQGFLETEEMLDIISHIPLN